MTKRPAAREASTAMGVQLVTVTPTPSQLEAQVKAPAALTRHPARSSVPTPALVVDQQAGVAAAATPHEAPVGAGEGELCWRQVSEELGRRKNEVSSLLRRRSLRGTVIARFALAADGRASELRFDAESAPLAQEIVRGLFARPFSGPCPGEGRWVVQFVPR